MVFCFSQQTRNIMKDVLLTSIRKEEFKEIFEEAFHKVLDQRQKESTNNEEQFLNVTKASKFLDIAKPTIYAKCSKLQIPHFKKGKKLYFRKKELIEWLLSGKRKTTQQIQSETEEFLVKRNSNTVKEKR